MFELEKSLSKLKKSYDNDDIKYKRRRDVKNLFDLSIDKHYYKQQQQKKPIEILIVIILNMKVKEIKENFYLVKNIFI